jgi:hypothetical protein
VPQACGGFAELGRCRLNEIFDVNRAGLMDGNPAIVPAANRAGCADAAVVRYTLVELMSQRKALHAEQQQQQRHTEAISPMVFQTSHQIIVPNLSTESSFANASNCSFPFVAIPGLLHDVQQ